MSTSATPKKPSSKRDNSPSKGKGKAPTPQKKDGSGDVAMDEGEEEDEEDEDEEEEEDEVDMEEDDEDEADDDFEEIDPSVITSRRTRGARVDYTSEEALAKAGLTRKDLEDDEDETTAA